MVYNKYLKQKGLKLFEFLINRIAVREEIAGYYFSVSKSSVRGSFATIKTKNAQ